MDLFHIFKERGQLLVSSEIEDYEQYEQDCCKLPDINIFVNSPMKRSRIKRGIGSTGEKYDSFSEFILLTYFRKVKGAIVERNEMHEFLLYTKPNGKPAKFFPDFKIGGRWVECKGRFTETDNQKKLQHPEVEWFFMNDIKEMEKKLDSSFPGWRDEFIRTN
jgi:hypothetical protein